MDEKIMAAIDDMEQSIKNIESSFNDDIHNLKESNRQLVEDYRRNADQSLQVHHQTIADKEKHNLDRYKAHLREKEFQVESRYNEILKEKKADFVTMVVWVFEF